MFSQKRAFLILWKPPNMLYISGNGIILYFRKLLIFQEVTFRARKMKKKEKKEKKKTHENQKFHIFCLLRDNFLNISAKEKNV